MTDNFTQSLAKLAEEADDHLIQLLDRMLKARDNWNGLGAPAPNHHAIAHAALLARAIEPMAESLELNVSTTGGVRIEWTDEGRTHRMEVTNDGTMILSESIRHTR